MTTLFIRSFAVLFSCSALTVSAQKTLLSNTVTLTTKTQKRADYQHNITQLNRYRSQQYKAYRAASSTEKRRILNKIKTRLETELTQNIFPAWYGTPWDFNGITTRPGKGKIACGYFVSTCLTHLGYKVPRIKLAQQPSQKIIRTFVARSSMDISSKRSLSRLKQQLLISGNGIYIVGLDTHVGFVTVRGENISFIHSSYYNPTRYVKAEPYNTKNPLADSKYRVFGKLFHDQMLINWLNQKTYVVAR